MRAREKPALGELRPIGEGEPIELTKDRLLIGRHRFCDVVLHSPQVAPVHCQLYVRHFWWYVRDLSGTQDTKVNALPVGESRLVPGDILWIGIRHKYEVCYDPEALSAMTNE
jgi:pSer/pThr/pTyr-binding forkhead associated (FHA) protein